MSGFYRRRRDGSQPERKRRVRICGRNRAELKEAVEIRAIPPESCAELNSVGGGLLRRWEQALICCVDPLKD
jgi:hypothetical protein